MLIQIGAGSRDDVAEQLLHLYVDHCRLSEAVQALDRMYEVSQMRRDTPHFRI
jgi:hypothetical protein